MLKKIIIPFICLLTIAMCLWGCGEKTNNVKIDITEEQELTVATESVSDEHISEKQKVVSEDPIKDFYDEFMETGTVSNIREIADKYGLSVGSRMTGTGKELFKVAETYDESRVVSNTDADKGDYFVRIECTILGDDTVDSVELFDNRNTDISTGEDATDIQRTINPEDIELDELQIYFCNLTSLENRDGINKSITDNGYNINWFGGYHYNASSCYIGLTGASVSSRPRDREGAVIDVYFTRDGSIEKMGYTIGGSASMFEDFELTYEDGHYNYNGMAYEDGEEAMRLYLADVM